MSVAFVLSQPVSIRMDFTKSQRNRMRMNKYPYSFEDGESVSKETKERKEEERMKRIRSLQDAFYSADDAQTTTVDSTTGIVSNLSLWRVGWVELPGRSNVLNVHEAQYTHMFESIIRGPKPWYFGHLHLEGGSKFLQSTPLQRWDAISDNDNTQRRSAKVGCLMQICDYRRLKDGRLILLVHALERFAVDKVIQSLPFSVADVQILPDQVDDCQLVDENFAKIRRSRQVTESFLFHTYEFNETLLPLPVSQYLTTDFVFGSEFYSILPFCSYSKNDTTLLNIVSDNNMSIVSDKDGHGHGNDELAFSGGSATLESKLLKRRVLQRIDAEKSAHASETLLWLAVEDYTRTKGFQLPEQVLALKPPDMSYLDLPNALNPLTSSYPVERRQSRFSYVAAGFMNRELWQGWLQMASTKDRLASVLEEYQRLQDQVSGEFL
jgi:Lon protease-like protein